jgi:hypothetical protein
MAKVYKIWTQIEEIDEEEDEYEILCGSTRGVCQEFDTLEEAKTYQASILGE